MLGVRLSEDMEKNLSYCSKVSKRSKSSIVKEAISQYLEDRMDYYMALERLEAHKKNGSKTYSLEEVAKELGLDNE